MSLKTKYKINLPTEIMANINNDILVKHLDLAGMTSLIDFKPPFLRTTDLYVYKGHNEGYENSYSMGHGIITQEDVDGHFNKTVFLAFCGLLMASTASAHLAYLYPEFAPQVVEADKVKPIKGLGTNAILKPTSEGSHYFVETFLKKKKSKFIISVTYVYFGDIKYGTIEKLSFALTDKESIYSPMMIKDMQIK